MAVEQPCGEYAGKRHEQRADERTVRERNQRSGSASGPQRQAENERDAGAELQQQPERAHDAAIEPHTRPDDRCTFDGPGRRGPPRIEPKRNSERREHDAERQKTLDQQPDVVTAARVEEASGNEVERGHRQRAESHSIFDVAHERALQAGGDQRRPENKARIHVIAQLDRTAQRVEHRNRDVEQEEHDQKRLRGREVLRAVARDAP